MPVELTVQQWQKFEGHNWWKWAVWIEGPDEALDRIDFVEWTLHPTFPHPVRKIRDRASKFRLETGGWGGFGILARVRLRDGQQIKLHHHLELHPLYGTQTTGSKAIAFCADGTWDSSARNTNVYKLFKSLTLSAGQLTFYDDGAGADGNQIWKLVGGTLGTSLWQKIKEGYTKIAHAYEAEDSLFLFGFSRGAYTARSLAGMIAVCGLPTKNFTDDLVEIAFQAYRDKDNRQSLLEKLKDCDMYPAKITMVGVWDTVGSLGIPSAIGAVDPVLYGFLDTGLHPNVLNAYHALAIDEKRFQFPPTLWTSSPAPGQTLGQVWFCGVHSDIGGGEPDDLLGTTALSDITLSWMMSKGAALGLQINANVQEQYAVLYPEYALDKLHDSWNVLYGFPRVRPIDKNAALANSVLIRCQNDSSYRPENLAFDNGVLSSQYDLVTVLGPPQTGQALQAAPH